MVLGSLLATVALARPLALAPSSGAVVTALPRTSPQIAELGIYENSVALRPQVAGWTAPGLQRVEVVDVTGGITFVVLHLARPELEARVLPRADGSFEVRIAPGEPELVSPRLEPTIPELVDGLPRRPLPVPTGRLLPLTGDARTYGLDPSAFLLAVPVLDLEDPIGFEDDLAPVERPDWDDIARWRHVIGTVRDDEVRTVAAYRLGAGYRDLGLMREATYYFGAVAEQVDDPAVHLARADGALRLGAWDIARASCAAASETAPAEEVLTCLGVLSLASADPPPAETGRALARLAHRPATRLLAGELLLRDGYADEALPLLESAAAALEGDWGEVAHLALGDAWMVAGDVDRARSAYLRSPHLAFDQVVRVRELMVRMSTDGVRKWPSYVPELSTIADRGGPAGADALYLLAQIHARYADLEAEAGTFARLWDLEPRTHGSDVPYRLLAACAGRIAHLEHDGRDAELVSAWRACWREDLRHHVSDVTPLASASLAWERLGFPESALAVQIDLTQILAGFGLEDPLALARLAHLQVETGVADQAIETLRYAGPHARTDGDRARLELELGKARAALGEPDLAIAAWDRVARDPSIGAEASARAAVLRLRIGRCEEAVPAVTGILPLSWEPDGELELLLARCNAALDRPTEAIAAAGLAWERAGDEWLRADAMWLATAIAERTGAALPESLRSDAPTFVGVRAEDERQRAWIAAVGAWKKGVAK